jgi:hypothetical protein
MYVRRSKRDASDEEPQISIAHNVRRIGKNGKSVTAPVVIAHLGSESTVDPDALGQLIVQLEKLRSARLATLRGEGKSESAAETAIAMRDIVKPALPQLRLLCSKRHGVRMLLDVAWRELGLGIAIRAALPKAVRGKADVERRIYAMVLAHLDSPRSKLATVDWLKDHVSLPGVEDWTVDALYQALDRLRSGWPKIEKHLVADVVRTRRSEQIAYVLADTTTIFTEADMDDDARAEINRAWLAHDLDGGPMPEDPRPQVVNQPALRLRGHSKDGHGNDPQIVMGVAAVPSGEVITHKIFPGNTSDKVVTNALFASVRELLPSAELTAVLDAGMVGTPSLRWLHENGIGWLVGMPIRKNVLLDGILAGDLAWESIERTTHRNRKPETATWSLCRVPVPVAHRAVADKPEVVVLVKNPARRRRDERKLESHLDEVRTKLAQSDARETSEVRHGLLNNKELRAFVRTTEDGRLALRPDAEARLRQALERQISTAQSSLAKDDLAQRDSVRNPVLRRAEQRALVRERADGRLELDAAAVAAARAAVSDEALAPTKAKVVAELAREDRAVVGHREHALLSDPKLRRYVRISPDGARVEVDEAAVAEERAQAGLRAMRTTAVDASAADVLAGYDQLLGLEATFRSFKDVLNIRPMHHRAEPRIRAHAMVCVLAERCMSWLEERSGERWETLRELFGRVHAAKTEQGSAVWWQRTDLDAAHHEILSRLGYRAGTERWGSDNALTVIRGTA